MNYNYLKNIVIEKEKEIKKLQSEIKVFKELHQPEFNKYVKIKQDDDKKWFINHFDYILRHQDKIMNKEPFSKIIIDFLDIYKSGGLVGGFAYNGGKHFILLKDLLFAWNNGFTYNDFPIISMENYKHYGTKKFITYIKNNEEIRVQDDNFDKDNELLKLIKNLAISNDECSHWDNYKTIDILKKREE